MRIIADLHIHSRFSLATSRDLVPEKLDFWARRKGIQVVGSGDFTHAGWLAEIARKTEETEPGLFALRRQFRLPDEVLPAETACAPVRFMLSAEISTVYRQSGRTRKVHHLVLAPSFSAVERLRRALLLVGANLDSDGRPIIGLNSRDLLEICLEASEECFLIPAHVWTPWFSVLGAQSGFDDISECYGELSGHIRALETGLSSDPAMNWRCSKLDSFTLLSNSDAHSPEKLGREANLFDCELSYPAMLEAMRLGSTSGHGLLGTLEFFPQEGKYHYDGHRNCRIRLSPAESAALGRICPECGQTLTRGVAGRVTELADRREDFRPDNRPPFFSLVPLKEILAEILSCGASSKKVDKMYLCLLAEFGPELDLLSRVPSAVIRQAGFPELAAALEGMRSGKVSLQEGYDGIYGRISLLNGDKGSE